MREFKVCFALSINGDSFMATYRVPAHNNTHAIKIGVDCFLNDVTVSKAIEEGYQVRYEHISTIHKQAR